jgi:hypothetical protein
MMGASFTARASALYPSVGRSAQPAGHIRAARPAPKSRPTAFAATSVAFVLAAIIPRSASANMAIMPTVSRFAWGMSAATECQRLASPAAGESHFHNPAPRRADPPLARKNQGDSPLLRIENQH